MTSVSSFRDINNSSLNRSKTKQTYSFCRSTRFVDIKPMYTYSSYRCDKSTYEGNVIHHKKNGSTIGNGIRSDFTKSAFIVPASSQYRLLSSFE